MSYKCDKCICKHCAIAQINGGAPGCGNCSECINDTSQKYINSCNDFYSVKENNVTYKKLNK